MGSHLFDEIICSFIFNSCLYHYSDGLIIPEILFIGEKSLNPSKYHSIETNKLWQIHKIKI